MSQLTPSQAQVIELVLSDIGLGVIAVDTHGAVIFSNPAVKKLLGAEFAEVVALEDWPKHCGIYLPDGITLCPSKQSPFARGIAGEVADNLQFFIHNQKNGKIQSRWCSFNLRPLQSSSGEIEGGILLIQDISEAKRLSDELARSNTALQQFATVAAHDLQEPLRSIAGFSEMLAQYQGDKLDEKSVRCLSKIKYGIKRMQALINDLLNFARVQTRPQIFQQTDCNEVLSACIKSLDASINDHGAEIVFDSMPIVVADSAQLSQVFQNLIGNALKFCAPDRAPCVRIKAKEEGLFWQFSIEDNGIGIEREFLERIFGVFQRLHNMTAYAGNGIGLAVCERIIDRHGGRIWVESEVGVGSTFFFTIPILQEETGCQN